MQTLVGILTVIPTRTLPWSLFKLCVWTRWCGGVGQFRQGSRVLGLDEEETLAASEIDFELKELEGHVTNVNVFTGVQFRQFGLHHVEILLDGQLILRYPVPVIQI